MKVRFTPSARSQFFAGLEYIKANNPLAALALLAQAKKSLRRLSTYPQSGRKIPEFAELSHRELIVPSYRFFYRVEKPTVWIVAVRHGAQLPALPQPGRRRTHKGVATANR
jgi:plasmid stabilization system protein ParE